MIESVDQSDRLGHFTRNEGLRRALICVGSFIFLVGTIWIAPVNRTQEARVLESAREMLGTNFHGWMIPHVNGYVRLQKPPLAYWMSAGSFEALGTSAWAGRLPLAIGAWLLVMLVYSIAQREIGSAGGFLAAGILLSTFLFFRYARVAETDVLMTLFVTLGIDLIYRGFHRASPAKLFALSGVAIGLAGLAKGPPALFVVLFLVGWLLVTRQWSAGARWLMSGAIVIAALIAAPWWIYAHAHPEGAVIGEEISVLLEGRDHPGTPLAYVMPLLAGLLPWTPLTLAAIFTGVRSRARTQFLNYLLVWSACITLPLCFIRNKQDHYLIPLMPPLALLTAWWIDQVARRSRFTSRAMMPAVCAASIGMTVVVGIVIPSMQRISARDIAAQLKSLKDDSYCFYGKNVSLPLVFELQTIVPQVMTQGELSKLAEERRTGLIVIAQTKSDVSPPAISVDFVRVRRFQTEDQKLEIYRKP